MACPGVWAQLPGNDIRVNQIGFYPLAPKMAVVAASSASSVVARTSIPFYIITVDGKDTVYTGALGPLMHSSNSSLQTRMADFSPLKKEGDYTVWIPGMGHSYPFRIAANVLDPLAVAALKAYYYQRCSMPLDARYAGRWSRPAGHPDTLVVIHPSAVSDDRPAGTVISATGGWYDAGDYNKYIVNSGITMGTLLDAYEDFSGYFDTLHTNIPPAGLPRSAPPASSTAASPAALPDILNEALYNLRWMLSMQDPSDGGVYHKCTNAAFDGMVMPGVTRATRYVVQKGTAATLDFAAVMAQAGRILRKFPVPLPGLADTCLHAATRAWQWALLHPDIVYDQEGMNRIFSPKITTGAYGDRNFKDEWYWAAVELLISTGDEQYGKTIAARIDDSMLLPSWGNVRMMGDYSLLRHRDDLPEKWQPAIRSIRRRLLQMADAYLVRARTNAFHTVMGSSPGDFVWGSNAVAANEGMLLIRAWLLTKDNKYLDNALGNLDYLLGRNATGYCFVTGMGSHSPMHPHHRPSVADGIVPPVPGLLVGGPNPGRQDHQQYDLTEPETSYADKDGAYASNEIAINWNAPLLYLAAAVEALQYPSPSIVSDPKNN